jgi:hypothetical protein
MLHFKSDVPFKRFPLERSPLRVCIDQKDATVLPPQSGRQINREGCLADSPFLVYEGDDHGCVPE